MQREDQRAGERLADASASNERLIVDRAPALAIGRSGVPDPAPACAIAYPHRRTHGALRLVRRRERALEARHVFGEKRIRTVAG
ncbi:MAG: hypothetical protein M5U28_16545 [Sandaracinaceae bacterium]|nr:hypothetical protein [Sandaracinaceae bacterium]